MVNVWLAVAKIPISALLIVTSQANQTQVAWVTSKHTTLALLRLCRHLWLPRMGIITFKLADNLKRFNFSLLTQIKWSLGLILKILLSDVKLNFTRPWKNRKFWMAPITFAFFCFLTIKMWTIIESCNIQHQVSKCSSPKRTTDLTLTYIARWLVLFWTLVLVVLLKQ